MPQGRHRETKIATIDPAWKQKGWDVHAVPTPDNSACAFIVREDIGRGREWLFYGGKLIAESQFRPSLRFEISPNGKIVTATPIGQEKYSSPYAIAVCGGPEKYETRLTTLAEIAWIGLEDLAWWGWQDDPQSGREIEGTRRVFLNGADVTGRFAFEKQYLGEKRFTLVAADRHCYAIADDGQETCRHPITEWNARLPNNIPWECADTLGFVRHHLWDDEDGYVTPRVDRGKKNHSRIMFRGQLGPPFHEIEGGDAFDFVQSDDGERLGYIAVRYPAFASLLTGPANLLSDLGAEIADYEGGVLSKLRNSLATVLDRPRGVLFSENDAGTSYFDSLARHYPVNGDKMWRQGYHYAKYPLFTPENNLVVSAWDGADGRFVVIDEKPGPIYDLVKNVRWSSSEKCVCYLAKRGETFFRVTVE